MTWQLYFTKQAQKDAKDVASSGLKAKVEEVLEVIKNYPYQNPPPYEKLSGNFDGAYSRRINRQHRIVYQVYEQEKKVKIIRMWTHYE